MDPLIDESINGFSSTVNRMSTICHEKSQPLLQNDEKRRTNGGFWAFLPDSWHLHGLRILELVSSFSTDHRGTRGTNQTACTFQAENTLQLHRTVSTPDCIKPETDDQGRKPARITSISTTFLHYLPLEKTGLVFMSQNFVKHKRLTLWTLIIFDSDLNNVQVLQQYEKNKD